MAAVMAAQLGIHPAVASTGDTVHTTNFATPCPSGYSVGVAFDGTYLWYSCTFSGPDLFRVDPLTGAVSGRWNIDGGIGAITYDATDNALWAGWDTFLKHTPPGFLIYIPLDGTHSVMTNAVDLAKFYAREAANNDLVDGIAYDAVDDSVYISPDQSTTIYRYSKIGVLQDSRAWVGSSCFNSGIAVGGDQIYEGADGCNQVYAADRTTNALVTQFGTGLGRTEGLACDSVTFAPKDVLWAVNNGGGAAVAYEIPAGSCGVGGRYATPPSASANAYTVSVTVASAGGTITSVPPTPNATSTQGTVAAKLEDLVLPTSLGEVVVGDNVASVPASNSGTATAKVATVTLNVPGIAALGIAPCLIQARALTTIVTGSSTGPGGAYSLQLDPRSGIADLNVCGQDMPEPGSPQVFPLPGGVGYLAIFDQINTTGPGTARLEAEAIHLHLTQAGSTVDVVVGDASVTLAI